MLTQSEPQRTGHRYRHKAQALSGTLQGELPWKYSLSAVAALLSANSNCRAGWYCNPRSSRLPVFLRNLHKLNGFAASPALFVFLASPRRPSVSFAFDLLTLPTYCTVSIVASAVPRNSVPADLHPPLTPVLPNILHLVFHCLFGAKPRRTNSTAAVFLFSPLQSVPFLHLAPTSAIFFSFFQSSLDDSATLANSRLTPSLFLSFFSFSLFTRSPVGCAGHQLRALHKRPPKINTSSLFFSRLIDNRLDPQRHSFPKAHPITPSTVAFGRSTPRPTSWLTLLCPRTRLLRRQYSKWITPTSTDDEASSLATFWETRLRSPPRLLLLCVPSRSPSPLFSPPR